MNAGPDGRTGGTLWLVATPIGNLGDLSPRAVDVLRGVGLICCEDTRRTGKLLTHAGVSGVRMAVSNDHTEFDRVGEVLDLLAGGTDVAVVTDAGTPGVSDPGTRLVQAAVDAGHTVSAVPGPDAATTALVISGLPTDRFVFEGFLPRSGRERTRRLAAVAEEPRTIVLYEAPHRIERTITDLIEVCGPDRPVAVCRELTKLHEEVVRGPIGSIRLGTPRGEYVVILAGRPVERDEASDDDIRAALRTALAEGASTRDAAARVAAELGVPKRHAYALAVAERSSPPSA